MVVTDSYKAAKTTAAPSVIADPTKVIVMVVEAPEWAPETCWSALVDVADEEVAVAVAEASVDDEATAASLSEPDEAEAVFFESAAAAFPKIAVYCCKAIEAVTEPNWETNSLEIDFSNLGFAVALLNSLAYLGSLNWEETDFK